MNCVSSSLDFYNKLGLEYWGINNLSQYYCDFKMPISDISEIPQIVKDSKLSEMSDERIMQIFEKLKNNGLNITLIEGVNNFVNPNYNKKNYGSKCK